MMINCYVVEVTGNNINRFVNKLFRLDVDIYDIKYYRNKVVFKVSYSDYLKIEKIKTIYKINIIGVSGVKRFKSLLKKYNIFIMFFIFSILFLIFLTNFIFFIEIDHSKKVMRDLIFNEMDKNGLNLFSFGKSYDEILDIKEKIKSNNRDKIEWLEIKHIGVGYKVSVIERIENEDNNSDNTNNIVASSNGLIMDMHVERGEIIKNKGDYVSKGDVIVSGIIRRNDKIVGVVDAKADVYAEVWYKVKLSASFSYKEKINASKGKRKFVLSIFDKDFTLFSYSKKINSEHSKNLFKSSFFKIWVKDEVLYEEIIFKYTKDELLKKLENEALISMKEKLGDNEKILLQKTLKNTIDDDKMDVEVFFKVYENIAKSKKIEEKDLIDDKEINKND